MNFFQRYFCIHVYCIVVGQDLIQAECELGEALHNIWHCVLFNIRSFHAGHNYLTLEFTLLLVTMEILARALMIQFIDKGKYSPSGQHKNQ